MARGTSGRIVLEVEPDLKHAIYMLLDKRGLTLKQWFLRTVEAELTGGAQLELNLTAGQSLDTKKQGEGS